MLYVNYILIKLGREALEMYGGDGCTTILNAIELYT